MNTIKKMNLLVRGLLTLLLAAGMLQTAGAQETVEYIHTDALGSPVAITDANGNVIERTVYEPYGAVVGGQVKDGPGYTGHVSDSATGLSYMQQRYMDPDVGAFLSVDPVAPLANPERVFGRYRYAANNPYTFVDPDGRFERMTGSQLGGGRGFAGSRVGTLGTSFRSPMDKVEGGEVPDSLMSRDVQTISDKVMSASDGGTKGSEARSAVKLVGIVDTVRAHSAASDARESAIKSGIGGLANGRGDAMRHCTWSCQMSRDIGTDNAKLIGDNHELWGKDSPGGRQMDLNNNASGRKMSGLPGSCPTVCQNAAERDQLDVNMGN